LETQQLVDLIALAANDKKGTDIVRIAVGDVSALADYFLIITGQSRTQVRAIASGIIGETASLGYKAQHLEGIGDGSWILLDFADVIVHIFLAEEREFYRLEAFWSHAPRDAYVLEANPPWQPITAGVPKRAGSTPTLEEELAEL